MEFSARKKTLSDRKKMRLLKKKAPISPTTTLPTNAASGTVGCPPRKNPPVKTLFAEQMRDYFTNVRTLPSAAARHGVVIETEEFMGEMLERQAEYTTKRPSWILPMDNLTSPVCDFFQHNAARVASIMPLRTDHFDLTIGQVSAAYYLAFGVSRATSFSYTFDKEKAVEKLELHKKRGDIAGSHLEVATEKVKNLKECTFGHSSGSKHHPGGIKMACMPTGTGKTAVCLAAAIAYLFTDKGRKRAMSVIKNIEHDPRTGVRFESGIASTASAQARFAPLVIVFTPAHLMNNWVNTANSFKSEVKRLHDEGVYVKGDMRVWIGTPKNEAYGIKKVAEDQIETVWIVSATVANFDILYEHNDVAYSCLIGDEMVSAFAKRNAQPASASGTVIIAQATMQALANFINMKNSFLEKCLGKDALEENKNLDRMLKYGEMTKIKTALKQGSKMVMCMMPDVLLQACATQAVDHMPKGITFYNLYADGASIYEFFASGSLSKGDAVDLGKMAKEYLIKVVREVLPSTSPTNFNFLTVDEENGDVVIDFEGMVRAGHEAFGRETAYQVLGLNYSDWKNFACSSQKFQEAVKNAQKNRRFETHPDKNRGREKEATEEFQKVEIAAEKLLSSRGKLDEDIKMCARRDHEREFDSRMSTVLRFSHCSKEGCSGGKMAFSLNSKTCVACKDRSKMDDISLKTLQPGDTSFKVSKQKLLKKVIGKCLNDHKRILMFCKVFEKSFFDDFDCNLVPLATEKATGDDSKKRKRGINGKQTAKLVDNFCEEPKSGEKPMILIIGEKELLGTDFHGTESLIVYGDLDESYRKQLYGRVLRMNKKIVTSGDRKFVNLYIVK